MSYRSIYNKLKLLNFDFQNCKNEEEYSKKINIIKKQTNVSNNQLKVVQKNDSNIRKSTNTR
ncbi:MAG: hypothetical protein BAJALOKI3v1_30126 [Promethearchaeota archaeon]|nr:MAG: hypothetical protein BAJALOKI3v1_30126 [Candidatus Lokiarchaeota archaeon]